ncbi:MAG: leucine--tRNA ligase [Bacteroidetes bacterium]|nr:leucine--tRNA ligase [Bacteroidota bacterium]
MSTYNFQSIEDKWQAKWAESKIYRSEIDSTKPKFYALDMFPYPSGAGLHVGHPLGYIASDIVSRYKRLNGYNVLHPMGFDAFGLPAEQYAIQTGQHPKVTTEINLKKYKEQLNRIGFSYDWEREVQTTDPSYYKWTQWIFIQLFESWYNEKTDRAERIDSLISIFEIEGNINVVHKGDQTASFTASEWENKTAHEKEGILQNYRLAFQKETTVNWCEELGTVLANDEVKDGLSERGGFPVTQKLMKQWYVRITAYADRLLSGLNQIEWSDSIKETQRNWIGKSIGARLKFNIKNTNQNIEVFTTRPDTIFGCTFIVLAPDHPMVESISTPKQIDAIESYVKIANNKSELERKKDKSVSGVFTGAHAIHPFTNKEIPIYISEYVLSDYGTGAIMAVPAHDERDLAFAKKFGLEIIQVIADPKEDINVLENSYDLKDGVLMNSENFDRLNVKEGMQAIIQLAEERNFGKKEIQFKLRDAGYSRQRYWGEPFPIIYKDGIPTVDYDLPLELPDVDSYTPSGTGESPLAHNTKWVNTTSGKRETDTMPGYAGSSWYFLRFMDPKNEHTFASKESLAYWNQVDLYIGGTEHATGHLLYSRFWTKFLFDKGYLTFDEPFKKLVNQGMIQGESQLLNTGNRELHVPIEYVSKDGTLTQNKFEALQQKDSRFADINSKELFDGKKEITLRSQVEKMSKSKFNVVNPDRICEEYGADTLRLYEMFLGPIQDSKPWSTKGIDGTHRFLKKLWSLFFDMDNQPRWDESKANQESLKTLHKTIKKITEDIDNLSLNTSVSQFMICVNELSSQNCKSRSILKDLLILLNPFAPHITEELWNLSGNEGFIGNAQWPVFEESYVIEKNKAYPISINGKTRTNMEFPLDMSKEDIESQVLQNEIVLKWLDGSPPKKVIVVPGRIVNIVV